MINFEIQFDNIESKFKDIESNLNNQTDLDTEKLIKLNKEYAQLFLNRLHMTFLRVQNL